MPRFAPPARSGDPSPWLLSTPASLPHERTSRAAHTTPAFIDFSNEGSTMESHPTDPSFTPSRAVGPGGPSRALNDECIAAPALAVSALARSYHAGASGCSARVQALRHIDLRVEQGEAVGILGPPGSGKSTLLLCLAGILRPDAGSLAWFGRAADVGGPPPGIAYVSQHRSAYPFMTVREAVEYHAMLRDTAVGDRPVAVEAAIEDTNLGALAGALVGTISHVSAARLAIAQALASRPRVVLLDETLSGLLPSERRDIAVIVRRMVDRAMTVVVAAEVMEVLDGIASRIAIVLDGRIAAIVAPPAPRAARTLELGGATPRLATNVGDLRRLRAR